MILSTGIKVNPLHVELKVADHPALKGCLMFGEGHTACGMLLEPKQADAGKEELVKSVWAAIEKANFTVPEVARVGKNLIVAASAEKPFIRAGKGTTVRRLTLKTYEDEIEEVYSQAGLT